MKSSRILTASTIYSFLALISRASEVTVHLDNATFVGVSTGAVSRFLGIPFAKAPRFRLPEPIGLYSGAQNASAVGPACPQQRFSLAIPPGLPQVAVDYLRNGSTNTIFVESEDCLNLNVIKPISADPHSKLPVVAWIYGGGFEVDSTSAFDGGVVVSRSIELGTPVIFVGMNYRLSGFGFLASKEVKDARIGNLGLQDQREALRWIQRYIGAFGGDPSKVTIWGESAGAMSVAAQMLNNGGDTEGLFRAAFMESGSPNPVGDITHGQKNYDALVAETGCSSASDTLECLRAVDYNTLKAAVDKSPSLFSYQSLNFVWMPRADGFFLADALQHLVLEGSVANVPFVTGDCYDEGTLFSMVNLNVTTDEAFIQYIATNYFPSAPIDIVRQLAEYYPSDIAQGSPYETGDANAFTPQYKRIASFQGDWMFQATRRFFIQQRLDKQDIWSFSINHMKTFPIFGSVHGMDTAIFYSGGSMTDYLINFVDHLDPNCIGNVTEGLIHWPKYSKSAPQMLTLQDGSVPLTITMDTYRKDAIAFLTDVSLKYPL